METMTAADAFPELYRAILDGVTGLEQAGRRAEAHRIRRDATATYSGAWSAAGQRRLTSLVGRVERALAEHTPSDTAGLPVPADRPEPVVRASRPGSILRNLAEPR